MKFDNAALVAAEGDERIDAGRAAGGEITRGEHDGRERERDGGEGDGVVRLDLEEEGRHEAAGEQSGRDTDAETDERGAGGAAEHECEHGGTGGAERHADADLALSAVDGVRDDTVEADRR